MRKQTNTQNKHKLVRAFVHVFVHASAREGIHVGMPRTRTDAHVCERIAQQRTTAPMEQSTQVLTSTASLSKDDGSIDMPLNHDDGVLGRP